MKVLVCNKPGEFVYTEKPEPVPQPGHAILKVLRTGICGTDLHAFEGTQPFFRYPRILGHELAATIVSVEPGKGYREGEQVTIMPYFYCGECIACRNGLPNCCVFISVLGVHVDGGMCEYLSVPTGYLLKGDDMPLDDLALVEPLSIGAHGVRRSGLRPGENVLVMGAGPIGLGIMEFAKIAGATVIAMDIHSGRLEFCRENLELPYLVNAATGDVLEQLQSITGTDMPTVVIDATGNLEAVQSGFQYLAHGGRYVLVGLQRNEISFNHPEFHKREATLMSSRNATREDFEYVMQHMRQGLVKPARYITHRAGFDVVKDNFESWLDPSRGVIKAMVEM